MTGAFATVTKKEKPARFVLRLPRGVHVRLQSAALSQGTSMNTMAALLIAEGLARRERRAYE